MAAHAPVNGSTLTPIDEALAALLPGMEIVADTETVAVGEAVNRVVASDQTSAIDVPGFAVSAMDGYALNSGELVAGQRRFVISQRIPAGSIGTRLTAGTAARIFTGAPVPVGADAVVMQENTRLDGETLEVLQSAAAGENVRPAGDDVRRGSLLVEAGQRLRAPDIGMLAGSGIATIKVRRPLRVAILTTGNELVRPGTPLQPGQIYNSNFYLLDSLLRGLGHEVRDCGIVEDTLSATEAALRQAAVNADCIISSGGVSAGEEDHVRKALDKVGDLALWKLAIKPGKPFAFGHVGGKPFFGLPGNPVSAFVTYALLVRPALDRLAGAQTKRNLPLWLPADFEIERNGSRQQYLRVRCSNEGESCPVMHLAGNQSSGVLSAVRGADGLAVVPIHATVRRGDRLRFIPLSEIVGQV